MIKIIDVFKPIPKNFELKVDKRNLEIYFNYKKYVSIDKVCETLLSQNDIALFDALSVFSKNHYKYRDILYYNLQKLTIEKQDDANENANYMHIDHLLEYFYEDDVYHELLHVASTYFDIEKQIFYSGFNYHDVKTDKKIGEGFMEGYVELLAQRDTRANKVIEKCNPEANTWESAYFYVNALARQMEILIGKEEMEDMFFENGFIRLKKWLLQYKDEKSIMKFFKNCDTAVLAQDYNFPILKKKTLDAQEFIFDICREFMPDKLDLLKYEKLIKAEKNLMTERVYDEIAELEVDKKISR